MRIVVDTNVLISAFFWGGLPADVVEANREGRCTIVTSEALLAELLLVLQRDKFTKQLQRMNRTPQEFLHNYRADVEVVDVIPLAQPVSDDPDDDRVLACALSGKAEAIVSGDDDLLRLKSFSDIPVMRPAEFLEKLKQND
jgi:putative PIN family toxin of toxin-antitoxin system